MRRRVILAVCLVIACESVRGEIVVPAFTAYADPDPAGVRVSARRGVTGWNDSGVEIVWFGNLRATGALTAAVQLRLPVDATSRLRLTLGDKAHETQVEGGGDVIRAQFGEYNVTRTGYHRFTLRALAPEPPFGDIESLILDGPATKDAHFNLKPRRNAASVHLRYPIPPGSKAAAFYCEVTGFEDPVTTYYMACGWHRGYFGMQVNSSAERRIIFSVWDSGGEPVDRGKVEDENRVALVARGEGVYAGDFGNEGTGGHSHLKYLWTTGEPQRFVVTAQPTNNAATIYSGYWFHPREQRWMLISSWRAPKDGGYLRGLYSFSENFGGATGHRRRKALYGNQWIRTDRGKWIELTDATFSHDSTGREDRLDRFGGLEQDQFFLSQGGFVPGFTRSGEWFKRPAVGEPPDIRLP